MIRSFLSLWFLPVAALWAQSASYTLTVTAEGFHSDTGRAVVMLYDRPGTIPDKELKNYRLKKVVPIRHGTIRVRFRHLKPGRYAVSLFHDENANGIIDKGLMLPKEGVGLSNFRHVSLFHLPDFKQASLLLDQDKTVDIHLIYF